MAKKTKKPTKQAVPKSVKTASDIVAVSAIIAIVVLYGLERQVPDFIGYGLLFSSFGAKWDEIKDFFGRGK